MFADLKTNERFWVILIGAGVAVAGGLLGGICGAGAQGVSLVMYLFIDPSKLVGCMGDLELAYVAGALCGAVAGSAWTCLFTNALFQLRRRSGHSPSVPLAAGNALVHSAMAGVLFLLLFLAWSLHRGTTIGLLTVATLVISSALQWLLIGLIGGAALRVALRRPAPDAESGQTE